MHIGGCQPCDPSTNQTNEDKNPIFRPFFYVLSKRLKLTKCENDFRNALTTES